MMINVIILFLDILCFIDIWFISIRKYRIAPMLLFFIEVVKIYLEKAVKISLTLMRLI